MPDKKKIKRAKSTLNLSDARLAAAAAAASDPRRNVSCRYLRRHSARMREWYAAELRSLIDSQDCSVDAVKLEWIMKEGFQKYKGKDERLKGEGKISNG